MDIRHSIQPKLISSTRIVECEFSTYKTDHENEVHLSINWITVTMTYLHDNELFFFQNLIRSRRLTPSAGLGHTLVGYVGRYMDLVGCVLALLAVGQGAPWPASSSLRRPSPQALTHFGGARFIAWRLSHPILGECWQVPRNFLRHRACLDYRPAPVPT